MAKLKAGETVYEVLDDDGTVVAETNDPPVGVRFNVKKAAVRKAPVAKKKSSASGVAHAVDVTDAHGSRDSTS